MNKYRYAAANPINLTDHSGFMPDFCSNDAYTASCDQLETALLRADQAGQGQIRSLLYTPIQHRELDFSTFKGNIQFVFGVKIGKYEGTDTTDFICKNPTSDNTNELTRLAAALTHIAAKLSESGFGNGAALFKSNVGQFWNIHLGAKDFRNPSNDVIPIPSDEGHTSRSKDLRIGGETVVFTIVHEFGHAIDYNFPNDPASSPLVSLHVIIDTESTSYGQVTYDNTNNVAELTQNRLGLGTRANLGVEKDEIWADMFMTWVLADHKYSAVDIGGNNIGWVRAGEGLHARAKSTYVDLALRYLFGSGTISQGDFIYELNQRLTVPRNEPR